MNQNPTSQPQEHVHDYKATKAGTYWKVCSCGARKHFEDPQGSVDSPLKHNWVPLCSDINTHWSQTYHWWRCANCGDETEHTKHDQVMPVMDGCKSKEKGSIFPLASV
jgi:hypothetical protein